MVRLEEALREARGANKRRMVLKGGSPSQMYGLQGEVNKPYHLMKADERIEEQNRMLEMLKGQREKDAKTIA